jgi:hypothetical protein
MERVLVAIAVVAVVAVVAWVIDRRRPDAPTGTQWPVPVQLDRADFDRAAAPWLVAVFSSSGCDSCVTALERAAMMRSDSVAVQDVEVGADKALHERYGIEAVPTIVVADAEGVVRASFVGPPPAAELWAAVAEVRDD